MTRIDALIEQRVHGLTVMRRWPAYVKAVPVDRGSPGWIQNRRLHRAGADFAVVTHRRVVYYKEFYHFVPIWHVDLTDLLHDSPMATDPPAFKRRTLADIDGTTLHHAKGHDPVGVHEWEQRARGRPGIEYHFWITETGEVLLVRDLESACWHDHTGDQNTHISVALAGYKDSRPPPLLQLEAAARVCAWTAFTFLYKDVDRQVCGHDDYHNTRCPGWRLAGWRDQFYVRLHRWIRELKRTGFDHYGLGPEGGG